MRDFPDLFPKHIRDAALQPVTDLLQGLQRHVLLSHLHPVQGRIADTNLARKLFERQITALLPKKFSELFCKPVCHNRNLGMIHVPQVGYSACATSSSGIRVDN